MKRLTVISPPFDPDSASAHNNLGGFDFKEKKMKECIAELRKASELEPNAAFRHATLGALLDTLGDHAGAAEEFGRAIVLTPEQKGYHVGLIRALAAKNDMGLLLTEAMSATS